MNTNTVAIYAAYKQWVFKEPVASATHINPWSIWLAATLAERERVKEEKEKDNGRQNISSTDSTSQPS